MEPFSTSVSFKMSRCLNDVGTDDFNDSFPDELSEFAEEFGDALQSLGELWIDGDIELSVDDWDRDGDEVTAQLSFSFDVGHPSGCSDIINHSYGNGVGSVTANLKTGEATGEVTESQDIGD